jgi:hypothetical protein
MQLAGNIFESLTNFHLLVTAAFTQNLRPFSPPQREIKQTTENDHNMIVVSVTPERHITTKKGNYSEI